MPSTFHGGVHPEDRKKATKHKPVETLMPPHRLIYPLAMHKGTPCESIVQIGEQVHIGQKIADSHAMDATPIHAGVSGQVIAIEPYSTPNGIREMSIVIENDGQEIMCEKVRPYGSVESLSREDLYAIIRDSGIVGAGGGAFPTHTKINDAIDVVEMLIVNGCESEPYLTGDHRRMLEAPEEIVGGVRVLAKLLNVDKAIIAVEANKHDAADVVKRTLPRNGPIQIKIVPHRFPQGSERQLIKAVTGREMPPGKLPMSVGAVVFNVETVAAIHRAVTMGLPFFQRVVTVAGNAVANAKNLRVRIGTPFGELFAATGGFRETPHKIIMGGPMMGVAQHNLRAPVTKSTAGLLAFTDSLALPKSSGCIRCGRCVRKCPMRLMPLYFYAFEQRNRLSELERMRIEDCIECGSCAYICPSRLHLVQSICTAKEKINAMRAKVSKSPLGEREL
ncbi:MAG: electron transport complex subunit RsxC [Oscillospiraceae bacterium]|nr:electron transport complex subunit RsxC [Oscillospiraceae bacterium]